MAAAARQSKATKRQPEKGASRNGNLKLPSIGGGFRLKKVQVLNWGTFDEKIWTLDLDEANALLTGENGSGKSTLVDALLTLLVPNRRRGYNLSAGSQQRERSELTYFRGAYGNEKNSLNQKSTKYLREEKHFSIICANFLNSVTGAKVSLAEFFWFENQQLKKFFIFSRRSLSIENDLSGATSPARLRKRLKALPDTQIFSTFSEYQSAMSLAFGFESSKALDLFNQTVSIKEIGRLTDFVRDHMLAPSDPSESLAVLYINYENLSLAYQAIVHAKAQLERLRPIAQETERHERLVSEITALEDRQANLPLIFARQ